MEKIYTANAPEAIGPYVTVTSFKSVIVVSTFVIEVILYVSLTLPATTVIVIGSFVAS